MGSNNDNDIRDVIRSMRADSPLRQQAEAVLSDPHAAIEDPQPILRAFLGGSPLRRKDRAVAAWLIQNADWSEDQTSRLSETLAALLGRHMGANTLRCVVLRWFVRAMILSVLLAICFETGQPHPWDGESPLALGSILWTLITSVFLLVLGSAFSLPMSRAVDSLMLRRDRLLVGSLGRLGDAASTWALADAYTHHQLRATAASALSRVAARLRSDDYGVVPGQSVPALCAALDKADDKVALVILQALSAIGDGRAISTVERVIEMPIMPVSAEVQKAAEELLPLLRQRAEESQAASLLLRASSATVDGGHVLLRAASGRGDRDSRELLVRASEGPGAESDG